LDNFPQQECPKKDGSRELQTFTTVDSIISFAKTIVSFVTMSLRFYQGQKDRCIPSRYWGSEAVDFEVFIR
jgi:hypothetical protein